MTEQKNIAALRLVATIREDVRNLRAGSAAARLDELEALLGAATDAPGARREAGAMSGRSEIAEVKRCAEWLRYCLEIGWKKSQLDALEKLWWKFHKLNHCPICLRVHL
jgi:hypothetical protein